MEIRAIFFTFIPVIYLVCFIIYLNPEGAKFRFVFFLLLAVSANLIFIVIVGVIITKQEPTLIVVKTPFETTINSTINSTEN